MKKSIVLFIAAICTLHGWAQTERQLDEVTVIASRTTNNAEGYTTNLRGSDLTKGKPAVEVLGFLPNISREQGNFKINGLAVSEIYVNGVKLTDVSELDNIPGERIDKVQVKYLAGSNQNAALSGGTIMITLRRPPEGGYYGSINANADWHRACDFGNEGIGGMFNYRYKNLSVYDNLNLAANKYKETAEQYFSNDAGTTTTLETSKWHGFDFRNRLSLSQQFASGATLGASYHIGTSNLRPKSHTLADASFSDINKKNNSVAQEGTVRFSLPLNTGGSAMELAADYFNRHSNENSEYYNNGENIAGIKEKYDLDLWKFSADFIYPHSRKFTWQFGASAQIINSRYTPTAIMADDRFQTSDIPTKTDGFTPIVYASAKGMAWKLRYSFGINWQLNRISYTDLTSNISNHNTQWSVNPTVQVMMPFGSRMQHAVMLNYKRTMSDIPYTAISSVINWSDANNYTVGNPDLKAQTADMVMVGLSLFKNKLNLTALCLHSHNRIWWQTFQNAANQDIYYTKPVNIAGQGAWGFGAEWMETPTKWWRFKLSGRVEITPENLTLGGVHYGTTRFKEYFYFNNNFTFSHGWGGMLNANLEPTYRSYDRTYHAVYNVGGRVYKNFLNDNLQVAVDFTALGNRRKLDRRVGNTTVSYEYTTPVQYVGLSVVWNFFGGKRVNVNVVDGIQDYREIKDNR